MGSHDPNYRHRYEILAISVSACENACTRQNLGCSHRLCARDKYKARENGSWFSSFELCEQ